MDGERNLTDRELLVQIDTKLSAALEKLDDHEHRIRLVEKLAWVAMGIASFGSLILKKLGL